MSWERAHRLRWSLNLRVWGPIHGCININVPTSSGRNVQGIVNKPLLLYSMKSVWESLLFSPACVWRWYRESGINEYVSSGQLPRCVTHGPVSPWYGGHGHPRHLSLSSHRHKTKIFKTYLSISGWQKACCVWSEWQTVSVLAKYCAPTKIMSKYHQGVAMIVSPV